MTFWNLEAIGICDPIHVKDDDRALDKFNNTICYQEGRYFITWPWKSDDVELLENFDVAFGRMKSLSRRLQADKMLLQQYSDVIQSQFEAGIIELVDEQRAMDNNKLVNAQTATGSNRLHYLPHYPVITPLKMTIKIRIVYDASVRTKKGMKILNECLYRGPITLPICDLCHTPQLEQSVTILFLPLLTTHCSPLLLIQVFSHQIVVVDQCQLN